jgi:lipid-A-disaccharide synthase
VPVESPVKIFFCAGETSSDLHAANLIRALRGLEPGVECEGLGGRRMQQAGMKLRYDLASASVMGLVEVVKALGLIRRLYVETVAYFERERPDAAVLIDFSGFNLRLAARARRLDIPVIYYISPQVWAWRSGRIKKIKRTVRKMLVILPFEQAIYEAAGVPCTYVGHPLLDHIAASTISDEFAGGMVIGLLPGSRAQEISRILPVMIEVATGIRARYPEARFIAPCVDEERAARVREIAKTFPLETVLNRTYDVLLAARFALVASGTATVETMLFGVPMVVMYSGSPVSVWLARRLVGKRVNAIAMVNILAGRHIVPEFIQNEAKAANILPHALELIGDSGRRRAMIADFASVRGMLKGGASEAAAREILEIVRTK